MSDWEWLKEYERAAYRQDWEEFGVDLVSELTSVIREMKAALEGIKSMSNSCLLGSCCISETCERGECEVQAKSNSAYGQAADIAKETLARFAF